MVRLDIKSDFYTKSVLRVCGPAFVPVRNVDSSSCGYCRKLCEALKPKQCKLNSFRH